MFRNTICMKKSSVFYGVFVKKNIFVLANNKIMGYKYKFDKENLVFINEKVTFKSVIKDNYRKGIIGVFIGFAIWSISFFNLIESPKKYLLEQRGQSLIEHLGHVNANFDSITNKLADIQHRDDNFYRVVSQLNPISPEERKQGFGGINAYSNLEGFNSSELLIESNRRSDIIERQLNLQLRSFDTIFVSVLELDDSLMAVPAISPVSPYDYHRISSPFGMRKHPVTGKIQKHDGLDFAARVGKPIYATGNGVVTLVRKSRIGYGNRVSIKHGFGYKTVYAHLHDIYVGIGDTIVRGQKIGTVGNTGTSTGPHLHYEVIYNNRRFDPKNYYLDDLSIEEFNEMLSSVQK